MKNKRNYAPQIQNKDLLEQFSNHEWNLIMNCLNDKIRYIKNIVDGIKNLTDVSDEIIKNSIKIHEAEIIDIEKVVKKLLHQVIFAQELTSD